MIGRKGLTLLLVLAVGLALTAVAGLGPAAGQQPTEAESAEAESAEASSQTERPTQATSCTICHGDRELFEDEPEMLQLAADFEADIHRSVGLSCHDCHGGNPDPELWEDYVAAKDEEYGETPYRGVVAPIDQPAMCGGCHSSAEYMRAFSPSERVDQETEYWTSRHGEALAAGDEKVARCTSCHGVHGIRAVSDPLSPVYPVQVAATCARCHGDAELMRGYVGPDGRQVPTNQKQRWERGVHGEALLERQDLSAPACNDCHGNHGAAPPGLDSVNFVCGQCHGREAELFRNSVKRVGFEEHAEFLLDAGDESCAACHEPEEAQSLLRFNHGFGECAACHGNHDVVRPTIALLSPLPETPCALCHEGDLALVDEPHEIGDQVGHYEQERDRLIAVGASLGLGGDARFDWLVDTALTLPPHTRATASGALAPRPEFGRLFEKLRIGKTSYEIEDAESGTVTELPILRCSGCHASAEAIGDEYAVGRSVATEMLQRMSELSVRVGHAERAYLAARRGGVETRAAQEAIDQAVDARIALDVLVHSFDLGGDFAAKHAEGLEYAQAAVTAAEGALEELESRRRGLFWALGVIALFLIALALKIREISMSEGA